MIDVDDLEAALGKLDIYKPGLSYRETAQAIADEMPAPIDEHRPSMTVQVAKTYRLLFAITGPIRGRVVWAKDGDRRELVILVDCPTEAGFYAGRVLPGDDPLIALVDGDGEEVQVLYDPAKVNLY